jgi:thiol-disulfide isomerase/thioredoxin
MLDRNRVNHNRVNRVAMLLVVGFLTWATWSHTIAADDDKATTHQAGAAAKADAAKPAPKVKTPVPENPFPNRVKIPQGILEGGTGWLNTDGEITMKDLRGKVVILDFWTYCCINCLHVLPDLKYLEKKYPNELVVIGVHSAKFDNEKETQNIRNAIQRHEIEHPVINDSKMLVWRKFGTRSWPTVVIVDPEGYYLGSQSGEGNRELLDGVLKKVIAYHRAKKTLDETPIRFDLERHKAKPTPLKYPGKVLADEKGQRLFTVDSNHNRIVISDFTGKLIDIIGNGAIGAKDGSYAEASFDHPQGLTLNGDTLYVADTENHLIRTVDLKKKTVTTLAGTGEQDRLRTPGGKLRSTPLNSPWALQYVKGNLYIAMAGPHQIWSHELGSNRIQAYAGSGREDIINGPLAESALAQPSGLATDGKSLFVCDSEGSSIRSVALDPKGNVGTIAGASDLPRGATLFEFGDVDDTGADARFQHPLGVVYDKGTLYIADTFNHKIKKLTQNKKGEWESVTWLGTGKPGDKLSPVQLSEPSGLAIANGKLFIADANNHRILTADLKTKAVTQLTIDGLKPPKPAESSSDDGDLAPDREFIGVKPQQVATAKNLSFEVTLSLPTGFKLNKLLPVTYRMKADGKQTLLAADILGPRIKATVSKDGTTATVTLPLSAKTGKATLMLALSYGYCRDGVGGLCKLKTTRWHIPVEVTADGKQKTIKLTVPVEKATLETKPKLGSDD